MTFSPAFFHDIWRKSASLTTLNNRQWEQLILLLRSEMLLARFAYFYADISHQFPHFVQSHLCNARKLADKQAKQVKLEAQELMPLCLQFSEQMVFLKGAAYTLLGGSLAKGRVYSDIDILVDKSALSDIKKRLAFKGWLSKPVNNYDEAYYREWMHEIPPLIHSNRGTILDIHHNIVPPISGKAPRTSVLFESMQEIDGGFKTLSPAALVVHSCVHLFFNEDQNNGYRDLIDIWLIIQRFESESFWNELDHLTNVIGFSTEVVLGLHYVSSFFGTRVPDKLTYKVLPSFKWMLLDNIYKRTLLPHHSAMSCGHQNKALWAAWLRGHWCKMPINILLYHFVVKGSRKLIEHLFGDHVFKSARQGH